MSQLSYFSSLEDVLASPDEELRRDIGYLAPDTVVQYVFYLRHKVDSLTAELAVTREEARATLPGSAARYSESTGPSDRLLCSNRADVLRQRATPAAPPLYEAMSGPASMGSGLLLKSKKVALRGHHNYFVRAEKGKVTCKSSERGVSETFDVVEIRAGVVAFKSGHDGRYLSAQPNGTLEWNRAVADIWEHFSVVPVDEGRVALLSHHGRYVSAQPGGGLLADRQHCREWEHFFVEEGAGGNIITKELSSNGFKYYEETLNSNVLEMKLNKQYSNASCILNESFGFAGSKVWVDKGCRGKFGITLQATRGDPTSSTRGDPTSSTRGDPFPTVSGSRWMWAHDGTSQNGTVEFLQSGQTRWSGGIKQGHWKLREEGRLLETKFNGVYHELSFQSHSRTASLLVPARTPPSVMWLDSQAGTSVHAMTGPTFCHVAR